MSSAATTAVAKTEVKRVVEWVPLGEILIDLEIQQRAEWEKDDEVVKEYCDKILAGEKFPAVVVFENDEKETYLSDGFHRYFAHELAEKKKIACEIRPGTRGDAIWYACGANSKHGKRRTNEDKRKAVATALRQPRAAEMTDRMIADHCGCSNTMVGGIRKAMVEEGAIANTEVRVNKNGHKIEMGTKAKADKSKAAGKAAAVKAAAKPPATKPAALSKSDTAKPAVEADSFDVEDSGEPAVVKTASAVQVAKPTAEITDGRVFDAAGTEIKDPKIAAVFKRTDQFHQIVRALRVIASTYKKLVEHDAGCFLGEFDDAVLLQLADSVEASTPKKLNSKYTNGWEPTNISKVDRNKDYSDGE